MMLQRLMSFYRSAHMFWRNDPRISTICTELSVINSFSNILSLNELNNLYWIHFSQLLGHLPYHSLCRNTRFVWKPYTFLFVCVCAFLTWMSVHYMCVWGPKRPKEGIICPLNEVTNCCKLFQSWNSNSGPLGGQPVLLTAEASL